MKIRIQVTIESDVSDGGVVDEIACLERGALGPETLGLTLAEARELLAGVQQVMVREQVAEYVEQQRTCAQCGHRRGCKHNRHLVYRTLFGKLKLLSPRLYTCACQSQEKRSFSPVARLLTDRTAPELLYLQTKWASLMSYGLTVDLLEEVLPLRANTRSVHRHLHQVAERSEQELGEEQVFFIEGCQREWDELPSPDGPLVVGIDGGFVHARDGDRRKAGPFEVIAGKSIPYEGQARCFALVHGYDQKPRRRLFDVLRSQGLQANQAITFLSDGGDTVRDLQFYLSPQAEHILDWFHLTMRITVLRQTAKGIPTSHEQAHPGTLDEQLERVKWFLWHGNIFMALSVLEDIEFLLEGAIDDGPVCARLYERVREFAAYILTNRAFIPNYGDRFRYGERIATGFVESTVNQVVAKRFEKRQQMRWTQRGAHLLLQVRVKVLNDEWRDTFCRWYPRMAPHEASVPLAA